MEISWMGRYRELVRALVYYSNTSNKSVASHQNSPMEYSLSQHQYQILEYICEHEDENRIMTDIARDLGLIRSNITASTKALQEKGLVEKFRTRGNKKNIILKPTEEGREAYKKYSEAIVPVFRGFFDELKDLSDEDIRKMERAIMALSSEWNDGLENELAPVD